jgi:gas vesicle protein
VKVSEAKSFIENVAKKKVKVPILMVGSMGIGKSQIVRQASEALGYQMIDLRLAQQEPGDLIGIPREHNGKTMWAKPEWWPEEGTKGILFLDELNRAPVDVRQAVFQLVNEWRMHTHKLPDSWFIVSAINPDNGNYQTETLDPAMLRRFCVIKVTPDVETWLSWAMGPGKIDKSLTGFVSAHRQMLALDEEFSIEVKPTPDQYRMLNDLMAAEVVTKEIEIEIFSGLIGNPAAIALRKFLDANYSRPVSGESILNEYDKVKKKIVKQRNDEMFATITELIAQLSNIKKLSKKQIENLTEFVKDIGPEHQATLIVKIPRDHLAVLASCEEITEQIAKALKQIEK